MIKIVGLYIDDTPTIVHIDKSETKVKDVIQAALVNAGKVNESADDYILFEETVASQSQCSPSPVFSLINNDNTQIYINLRLVTVIQVHP